MEMEKTVLMASEVTKNENGTYAEITIKGEGLHEYRFRKMAKTSYGAPGPLFLMFSWPQRASSTGEYRRAREMARKALMFIF
jgi:hypothetical protein